VQICREHLAKQGSKFRHSCHGDPTPATPTSTGQNGLTKRLTYIDGRKLNISPEQVLPFSTGVIMEPLPYETD
jgi:glutamate N-acetyltransferase/amino-acid N-acetyltransferase